MMLSAALCVTLMHAGACLTVGHSAWSVGNVLRRHAMWQWEGHRLWPTAAAPASCCAPIARGQMHACIGSKLCRDADVVL